MFKPNIHLRLGNHLGLLAVDQPLIEPLTNTACYVTRDTISFDIKYTQLSNVTGKSLRGIGSQVCNICTGLLYTVSLKT
ncbi:hypothetical protein [Aquimarina pacifica]|uniref:hypothetical protein n=1 Tax=Aquimarina pacifica TaxID=1296415 RepID=UPI0004B15474|nr:hypothetical protein [Aquimarina pacifica]